MKKRTLLPALLLARRACLWAALGLLVAIGCATPRAQAAVIEAWVHRYNGPTNSTDIAVAVAVDGSGNVVVTGYSDNGANGYNDYYTAKYAAADGALLWEKRYNGTGNGNDSARAVVLDGRGNVVVTGDSDSDYYTVKYASADGALLWEKRGLSGVPSAVVVDSSGNVVVTGYSIGSSGYAFYYTVKYGSADGALLWEKHDPFNPVGVANAVAVDGSGNVVVTGTSYSGIDDDYYTAKYAAANGALLWEKRYNGPAIDSDDHAQAVAMDGQGNVVVTGYSDLDYCTVKYAAANGALLWEQRDNDPASAYELACAVAVDGSGNVAVTGHADSDYCTVKYASANGALLWKKRGPSGEPYAVAVDGSGNVVVTGHSYNINGNTDYYTAKYAAANGALLWEQRYNGPANSNDIAAAVAVDGSGTVAVTGYSVVASRNVDYATVVYRDDVYPIRIAITAGGIRLRFTGIPSRSYTIERAPAVTGPWSTLATPTSPASGLLEYLDTDAPVGSAFYRTVQ